MSENELLLRHAERWASDRKRVFDAEIVDLAVTLRATHDGEPANRWRAGSVKHLMLVRWPAHGPAGVPDVDTLVASLDTFWRFLRSTGRMAGSSADPKVLLAEAKGAARKMPAACLDENNFGAAKGILDFGREIGIDLDGAGSMEELNERLQQVVNAWNAQPDDERMGRPLGAGGAGSLMGEALTTAASSVIRTGELPPGWQLPQPPRLDAEDDDEEERLRPNDPAVSAPFAQDASFLRRVLALAEWADGKELTATKVLRPAVARAAFDELDLWSWERDRRVALGDLHLPLSSEEEQVLKHVEQTWWRSAGDCVALDRLWAPAVLAGLIDVSGARARRAPGREPVSDVEWVTLSHTLGLGLVARLLDPASVGGLLTILFSLAEEWGGGPLTVTELQEAFWQQKSGTAPYRDEQEIWRSITDHTIASRIAQFDDCGWWRHRRGHLVLTPLGWDAALLITTALDERWLWPDDGSDF